MTGQPVEIPVLEGQTTIEDALPPRRIQRKRSKGWRMPPNTVYVGRPSKWGNAIDWRDYEEWYPGDFHSEWRRMAASDFGRFLEDRDALGTPRPEYPSNEQIRVELAGKNLACWCPVDTDCHADVLLEIANGGDDAVHEAPVQH